MSVAAMDLIPDVFNQATKAVVTRLADCGLKPHITPYIVRGAYEVAFGFGAGLGPETPCGIIRVGTKLGGIKMAEVNDADGGKFRSLHGYHEVLDWTCDYHSRLKQPE